VSDPIQEPDELLGFLAEEGRHRRDPEEHPAPEVLTAYHAKELSREEEERFQEHLAVCRQCTELLLDLDEFLQPPPVVAEPVAEFDAAADRRKLREGLGRGIEQKTLARPDRRRFFASVWGGYSVAAALLVISVGLGIWNAELFREIRKPQPIRTVQTLTARGSTRGGDLEGEPLVLPADITLLLPTETPSSLYKADFIRHGSRRPEWSLDVAQAKGELNIHLPAEALPLGNYTVQVAPLGPGRPGPESWNYPLRIVSSAR
jgi:hypothetical protein